MDIAEKINLFSRLDNLIRRRATGSPKELSVRIGISERQIYNIINEMKCMGAPIVFCQQTRSYYYEENVIFRFGFILEKEAILKKITGGKSCSIFHHMSSMIFIGIKM